ncbi:MAG: DUF721 domain-containing protein [Boseongicola sp.]
MPQGRRRRGFERAASLMAGRIREAGESRGFAVSRLLTHWDDIVGSDLSGQARPVEVSYGRGFGATLTLLTNGATAPMVEMQKEQIRERVNACYGYAAISRIRLTQTSAVGFSEPAEAFETQTKFTEPDANAVRASDQATNNVSDEGLRAALARLGANVLSQSKQE